MVKEIKKLCQNFSKKILDTSPIFCISSYWYYDYNLETIGINTNREKNHQDEIILKFFKEKTKSNFSLFTYGFLHELGHFYSNIFEKITADDFFLDKAKTEKLEFSLRNGKLDFEQAIKTYYLQKTEKKANAFVKLIVAKYSCELITFEKELNKIGII